jgi:uncharacterized tellurite resistance protein B-like protein
VYLGSRAPSADGSIIEPSLIDPSLPVDWSNPDHAGVTMGYWPSYGDIDPRARAAYLTWLADGRKHPGAYIGYVFLFLYGIERRFLLDLGCNASAPESVALLDEVRRLLHIYGDSGSFRGYAGEFIDLLESTRLVQGNIEPPVWSPGRRDWRVPASVRIALGRYIAAGYPIPAVWALSYLRHHPEGYLRTPAERCVSEYDQLFKIRYQERFGEGIQLRPTAARLSFDYRAASGGFGRSIKATPADLPDVTRITGFIDKLKVLGGEVTDELDAYSRFIGRRPDEAATPAAVALLPPELADSHGGGIIASFKAWTESQLDGRAQAAIDFSGLLELWSPEGSDKFAKRDAVALATTLERMGVGIEPDVRFGMPTPKQGTCAALFRLPSGSTSAPSAAYTAAVSLVHLTAIVAAADGSISSDEQNHLASHMEGVLGLDAGERARLDAHLCFLAAGKISVSGAKRKVELIPEGQRAAVGRFLIDVAAADGVISPSEISTLTKVFAQLGLDESDLFSQVHALESGDRGPVTVREAEPSQRWSIPEPPTAGVTLDPAKVQARLAETAHVAALLTDIFAADDSLPDQAPPAARPATWAPPTLPSAGPSAAEPSTNSLHAGLPRVGALDPAHSELVRRLATRPVWDRAIAEDLSHELGLPFLDAAVDRINDQAFESCGEPLLEGDDLIEVNEFCAEELLK